MINQPEGIFCPHHPATPNSLTWPISQMAKPFFAELLPRSKFPHHAAPPKNTIRHSTAGGRELRLDSRPPARFNSPFSTKEIIIPKH
jgi:hypothetical protein